MSEMDRAINDIERRYNVKNNSKSLSEVNSNGISLLGKFDGQTMIQAVVMSELLSKPKAKRRKRGQYRNEGINCR